jgi:hypothetical protein
MIEIQCPRCTLYWYSDEPRKGRKRLCEACRTARRTAKGSRAELGLFFFATLGVLLIEAILFPLTVWQPAVFGLPVLVIGCILTPIGLGWFWFALYGWTPSWYWIWEWPHPDAEWEEIRWPLLILFVGVMHLTVYATFVMAARH